MTECKILTQVQNGGEIYNKLPSIKMKELEDFIEPFRSLWEDRFNKSTMKN